MSVRIKICGITNLDDATRAVELGADALGFIFYPKSRRAVTVKAAASICAKLPPFVARVGVFVNDSEVNIEQALHDCRLTALQFHGEESPEFCVQFPAPSIKAIRVRDEQSLRVTTEYDVDAILLDTYTDSERGGTGRTFDWALARQAKEMVNLPIILSGGLTPENVAEAVQAVRPYAVDVSSGVEREPGQKDPERLRKFFTVARVA